VVRRLGEQRALGGFRYRRVFGYARRVCTLAVYRQVSKRYPLIVVANRDEFLGRRSEPPHRWSDPSNVVAGRDLVAGGTWLGCRTDGSGRVVGILNRRPAADRAASGPGERSRGLLCIETLGAPSIGNALDALDDDTARLYGGFNLFVADLEHAFVADNGSGVHRTTLEPGLSVLTNLDVNDPRCPRLAAATRRFESLLSLVEGGAEDDVLVPVLSAVLASHDAGIEEDSDDDDPRLRELGGAVAFSKICVHVADYGTRSSSMIFVSADGSVRYTHADGPPCVTPFIDVAVSNEPR
jgi:uncharacterized protein with NRDE domain